MMAQIATRTLAPRLLDFITEKGPLLCQNSFITGSGKRGFSTEASPVTLPDNLEEIQLSEKVRFSPQRIRDVCGAYIDSQQMGAQFGMGFMSDQGTLEASTYSSMADDGRLDKYDSPISISLSSVMQTNVPEPFNRKCPTHLNMPGGHWAQDDKYISGDMQDYHDRCFHTSKVE